MAWRVHWNCGIVRVRRAARRGDGTTAMTETYYQNLCAYAKAFVALTPERERLLAALGPGVLPHLDAVTNQFYAHLQTISRTAPFLEGRLPTLRRTHRAWLEEVFTANYDAAYAERMFRVGDAHVRVDLPVEFMAGGMTAIADALMPVVTRLTAGDVERQIAALGAVNAALGFALIVMQESYQISRLLSEQEKFLAISGMSRTMFNNLAATHGP